MVGRYLRIPSLGVFSAPLPAPSVKVGEESLRRAQNNGILICNGSRTVSPSRLDQHHRRTADSIEKCSFTSTEY